MQNNTKSSSNVVKIEHKFTYESYDYYISKLHDYDLCR